MKTDMQAYEATRVDQTETRWDVAVDVSKETLSWYAEAGGPRGRVIQHRGVFDNHSEPIFAGLSRLKKLATELGYTGLRIICEPTGGYERRLLRAARHAGCATA